MKAELRTVILKFKKYFLVFVVAGLILVLFRVNSSMATVYECSTGKVFKWNHDQLLPDKSRASRNHSILRFDDETGTLFAAFDQKSAFIPSQLNIVQKMNSSGELTAFRNDIVNNMYVSTDIFQIKTDKIAGITFLHYISLENRIAIGKCQIEESD